MISEPSWDQYGAYYITYDVAPDDGEWAYGEYPNEPVLLTRSGYRELLRCLSE